MVMNIDQGCCNPLPPEPWFKKPCRQSKFLDIVIHIVANFYILAIFPLTERGVPLEDVLKGDDEPASKKPRLESNPEKGNNKSAAKKPCIESSPKVEKPKFNLPIDCGKCDKIFEKISLFKHHIAIEHGGVAKPKNMDQNMTEEEVMKSILDAFKICKKLFCYLCLEKSFTTKEGYKQHLKTCGKTDEELDAMAHRCPDPDCEYKTMYPQRYVEFLKKDLILHDFFVIVHGPKNII